MASDEQNSHPGDEVDLAQAFKDVAKGEQQASALENNLTALEKKIDDLLARAQEDQKTMEPLANNSGTQSKEPGADSKETTKDETK
ncbi:MAG: hypothetical protein M1820_000405 [Bogoriella megaspora]|nr:MAG: hypothetical protein M1820_000405 [Bogoriella megaspora]